MYLGRSHNLTVQRCKFNSQEGYGIRSIDHSATNQTVGFNISNNEFEGQNAVGMHIRVSNSIINNNVVNNIALLPQLGLRGTFEDNLGGGNFCFVCMECKYR